MNTTIHSHQGQNKTKPLLEKTTAAAIVQPTGIWSVHAEKSKFSLAGSSWKEVGALKLSHSSDQRKQRQRRHLFSSMATAS